MRVGVLTTSYPRSDDDPAGGFVAGLTRWMAQHAEIDVLCAGAGDPLFYGGGAPGALAAGGIIPWARAFGFSARLLAEAARRARHWDAIVSHWLVPSGAIGMLLSGSRPHLAIAHGSDTRLLARLPGGLSLARAISRRADLVYVARALELDGAPGRVAPMGIDCASLAGGDRERTRRELGLDGFTVLYLGRLSHEKAPDLAVRALPENTTLLIAGDGPMTETELVGGREAPGRFEAAKSDGASRFRLLGEAASDGASRFRLLGEAARSEGRRSVRLLGEVRGGAKRDLLAACDALIVPSRSDGAPVVVLEAMAAGLPILATGVGGIPELIEDGVTGVLCEAEARALAHGLTRLRDLPSLRALMAANGRRAASAHDWASAAPRIVGELFSQQLFHSVGHRVFHRKSGHAVDTFSTANRRIVVARC